MSTLELLEKRFRGKIISSKDKLLRFSRDESSYQGSVPIAIFKPTTTADVSKFMKFCFKNNVKVTVRGAGSSLSGSSVPDGRCVVLDMSGLNRIIETNIEDRCVIAEPGVILNKLNSHLSKYGYFYPPDPGSSAFATVGGTVSTNAGGLRAVTYGTTKEWVLGLELVLADGTVIKTGEKVLKRSMGYDLTALIVASEGTLGVITKAILKIWPKPEATGMIVSHFANIADAGNVIARVNRAGIIPLTAEFVDRKAMDIMQSSGGVKFPDNANYTVLIELISTKESIAKQLDKVEKLMAKCGALKSDIAKTKQRMEKLYASRKYIFTAMKKSADKMNQGLMIADVVVPVSELSKALPEMQRVIKKCGLEVVLFGHIGDGNVHANILYSIKQYKLVENLEESLGRIAIRHNGSVSGEHGIGMLKKKLLKEEFGERNTLENLVLMKRIKHAFDPRGILNKGKIFD
jgi:glycolate oxidase